MSIYIDARMIKSAGIGTYLKNILPYLDSLPITLILREEDLELFSWLNRFNKTVCDHPIYSIQEQIFYKKAVPKCDLFWSPHINVPYFSIKARKRLVTIHDVYHLAFFSRLSWKEKLYAKRIYKRAVLLSDAIITDSNFSKSELIKYTDPKKEKIQMIHCGIDRNFFSKKDENSMQKTKCKYFLDFPYFLFVGNIKPHKNVKNLIKAFQKFSDKYHLVLIGKVKGLLNAADLHIILDENLKRRVHIYSEVLDEELPVFYQLAQATVFPSIYEGFGLPLLEAMSCGSAVLASNAASIPEVGGDAPCYFNPYNISEIVHAMEKVVRDTSFKDQLIQNGYQRVKQFSWRKSAQEHKKVIHRLLA